MINVNTDLATFATTHELHQALGIPHLLDLQYPPDSLLYHQLKQFIFPWYNRVVVEGKFSWLVLLSVAEEQSSGRGVGKTHIASSIFYRFGRFEVGRNEQHISWWPQGHFWQPREFLQAMKQAGTAASLIGRKSAQNQIVVLDDWTPDIVGDIAYVRGDRQENELQSMFYSLIDWLLHEQMILIITANMSLDQFTNYIGTSAMGRIKPHTVFVDFTGMPNFRFIKAEREIRELATASRKMQ